MLYLTEIFVAIWVIIVGGLMLGIYLLTKSDGKPKALPQSEGGEGNGFERLPYLQRRRIAGKRNTGQWKARHPHVPPKGGGATNDRRPQQAVVTNDRGEDSDLSSLVAGAVVLAAISESSTREEASRISSLEDIPPFNGAGGESDGGGASSSWSTDEGVVQ